MTLAMVANIAASIPRILMVRMLSLLTKPSRAFAAGVGYVDQSVLLLVMGAKKRFITSIACRLGDIRQMAPSDAIVPRRAWQGDHSLAQFQAFVASLQDHSIRLHERAPPGRGRASAWDHPHEALLKTA